MARPFEVILLDVVPVHMCDDQQVKQGETPKLAAHLLVHL